MARQKGIHLFTGKISTTSGYKRAHDNTNSSFERSKGGPSIKQMDELPSMKRNREIMQEFTPVNNYSILISNFLNDFYNLKGTKCRSQFHKVFQNVMLLGDGPSGERNFYPTAHPEFYPRMTFADFKLDYACPFKFTFNVPSVFSEIDWHNNGDFNSNLVLNVPNATHYRFKVSAVQIVNMIYNNITKKYVLSNGQTNFLFSTDITAWYDLKNFNSYSPFGALFFKQKLANLHTLTLFFVGIEFSKLENTNYTILKNKSYVSCVYVTDTPWT